MRSSRADQITILVYNIHAGEDAARAGNLDRVASIVKESGSEIVLLQEVDKGTRRSGGVDQLARLEELTGFEGVFGKTIDYDGGEYGIAILSRWPIIASSMWTYPVDIASDSARAKYEERGALAARIAVPGGAVRVVNTHLDATRSDSLRVHQAHTLATIAAAQRDSGFTIIGGDLNSEPGSAVRRMLGDAGWTDLFAVCGRGQPYSFPADSPVKRIDYLFAAGRVRCGKARVLETDASDHRPVLFEVVRPASD